MKMIVMVYLSTIAVIIMIFSIGSFSFSQTMSSDLYRLTSERNQILDSFISRVGFKESVNQDSFYQTYAEYKVSLEHFTRTVIDNPNSFLPMFFLVFSILVCVSFCYGAWSFKIKKYKQSVALVSVGVFFVGVFWICFGVFFSERIVFLSEQLNYLDRLYMDINVVYQRQFQFDFWKLYGALLLKSSFFIILLCFVIPFYCLKKITYYQFEENNFTDEN